MGCLIKEPQMLLKQVHEQLSNVKNKLSDRTIPDFDDFEEQKIVLEEILRVLSCDTTKPLEMLNFDQKKQSYKDIKKNFYDIGGKINPNNTTCIGATEAMKALQTAYLSINTLEQFKKHTNVNKKNSVLHGFRNISESIEGDDSDDLENDRLFFGRNNTFMPRYMHDRFNFQSFTNGNGFGYQVGMNFDSFPLERIFSQLFNNTGRRNSQNNVALRIFYFILLIFILGFFNV